MTFVEAVKKYGRNLKSDDLGEALKRCGNNFKGQLAQHFVVLKDIVTVNLEDEPQERASGRGRGGYRGRGTPRGRTGPRTRGGSSYRGKTPNQGQTGQENPQSTRKRKANDNDQVPCSAPAPGRSWANTSMPPSGGTPKKQAKGDW